MRIKRYLTCVFLAAVICLLGACGASKNASFNGSKTGNKDHFSLTFDILNTTYTHEFDMKQGESISVHIEKKSGDIKVKIQGEGAESIYEGNGEEVSDFSVSIPREGTYTVSVTGKRAKGQVTFSRERE